VPKRLPSARRAPLQPVGHGPSPLMGADGAGVARAVCWRSAGAICLARRVAPAAPDGRGGDGPCQGGVADRRACGARPLAGRVLGPRDQAARGDDRWPAGEALAVLDGLAPHHAAALATPRKRAPPVAPVGVVGRGRAADGPCPVAEPRVVVAAPCPSDRETRLDGGVRHPRGPAHAGRFGGALLPPLRPVLRAVGRLAMGHQLRPLAPQRHPPPAQLPCGAPGGRIPIRRWEQPATAPARPGLGVELGVCRVAPRDGLPQEGRPKHLGQAVARAEEGAL
jgi:hypothetical protein